MNSEQAAAVSAEPARAAVWEDFLDIFYAPSSVFARRENGNFWIPMSFFTLLLGLLSLANSGVLQPVFDAEFRRGMAAAMRANPQLTPEVFETGRQIGTSIARIAPFVFGPLVIVLVGLMLWLLGKLFDATQSLRAAMVVTAYSYMPKLLESVLISVQGLLLDPDSFNGRFRLSLGVGRFLHPDTTPPVIVSLLGRVDVFTIWVTILLAIGLSVTGKISRSRSAIAAALLWGIGALPLLLHAMRM